MEGSSNHLHAAYGTRSMSYVLPFVLVGSFLSIFDQFVINVAAAPISRALEASAAALEIIAGGYSMVYALGLITGGRIGDRYGRLRTYRIGLFLFAVTSALCGLSQTAEQLAAARLLQGVSGAVMVPQVLALIRISFAGATRVLALSLFGVSIGMGQICGQIGGGLLPVWNLFGLGWRLIFLINMPVCLIACIVCGYALRPDHGTQASELDCTGIILSAGGCVLVLLPAFGGGHLREIPMLLSVAAGLAVSAAFIRQQRRRAARGHTPLVPFQLFLHRGYRFGTILSILLYIAVMPFFFVFGLYLQQSCRLGSWEAGLTFAPVSASFIIGSSLGPTIVRHITALRTLILGTSCTTLGLICTLAWMMHADAMPPLSILGALCLFGFGNGTTIPIATGVVLRDLPASEAGAGAAVLTTGQQFFGGLGIIAAGAIVLTGGSPPAAAAPYINGLIVQTICALSALSCAIYLVRTEK